ncbi:Fic family protein [Lactobacillus sp.]|uniref:Fic/DOC family protein n=1 Tax=Lactobacillus sp. TaxID=1591 RepID=UPI0019ACF366|nr:Fic family protein [Lactobacillus sp.]MBD5429517.1 cell filamentation protein Fic [Lactobacillus sp.]
MADLEENSDAVLQNRFLYPNGTLKNKLGITDFEELEKKEYFGSSVRALAFLRNKKRITSVDDLKAIHKIMFGWLYDWAGEFRDYQLTKGSTEFLDASRLQYGVEEIDSKLNEFNKKDALTALEYAFLLDRLNYLHPFREGNGRSSKVFLQCLAANHQQVIEYPRTNKDLIIAQENADLKALAALIKIEATPIRLKAENKN